jgi:hypothetical protein
MNTSNFAQKDITMATAIIVKPQNTIDMKRKHLIITGIIAILTFGAISAAAVHFKHHANHDHMKEHCWGATEQVDIENQ